TFSHPKASANVKKQICEANRTTLKTCMRLIVSVNVSKTWSPSRYRSMSVMAEPVFGDDGSLVDCGVDLNKNILSGCQHRLLKDVILLTAIIQVLSTISSSFWYLWLFVRLSLNLLAFYAPEYTWEENEKKLA
uniref:Transmembrane protein 208 n=1 Tax=Scleropages formosus TaxID=113540 RepID=A0A8C9VV90_SCLFO